MNIFYRDEAQELRVSLSIDEVFSTVRVRLRITSFDGLEKYSESATLKEMPQPLFFTKIKAGGKNSSSGEIIPFNNLKNWLHKKLDNALSEKMFIDDLNEKIEKNMDRDLQEDIDSYFLKAISYGPVGGADLYFKGVNGADTAVFRVKGEAFIQPKDFMIWYSSYYNTPVDLSKSEWQTLLRLWLSNAKVEEAVEDPLVPKILDELAQLLTRNKIVRDLKLEEVTFLQQGKSDIFWLVNDTLRVHSKIYGRITQEHGTTPRKVRQLVEKYLLGEASRQYHRHREVMWFWVFKWDKLCMRYPFLTRIPVEMEIKLRDSLVGDEDGNNSEGSIFCPSCDTFYNDSDYCEHLDCAKHNLKQEQERKKATSVAKEDVPARPVFKSTDGYTLVRILKDQPPIAQPEKIYHLRRNDIVYLPEKLANLLLMRIGVAILINVQEKQFVHWTQSRK